MKTLFGATLNRDFQEVGKVESFNVLNFESNVIILLIFVETLQIHLSSSKNFLPICPNANVTINIRSI